ncbi:TetR/AcrR family transcriptional regulator C-terminal domain-containing protein [Nocardia sp. NBC_01327]|uniref:TetR/AcrR family transcriptional regulator C-terminal domain-containing protein n=1 Tax=Nocardia sp. NBC_01327 TaxID=2903593 RepID=UPI002E0FB993|nr:TetR/AcrR family transcriptional regulator C-terminal domain-containing protein [Nocardia sp. NBC_01327]
MPPKRTRAGRAGLSREQVLDAALTLADRDGVAALSMRKLGAELGVEAMTLYHYLPNKDALLDGLVERVLSDAAAFDTGDGPWTIALRDYARLLRAALLRHPGVLPLIATRPAVTPQTLRTAERGLEILCAAGFPVGSALSALNALTLFVIAHATAEVDIAPVNAAEAPGSADYIAELDPEQFPLLVRAAHTAEGTDDGARFDFAIEALITGYAATL